MPKILLLKIDEGQFEVVVETQAGRARRRVPLGVTGVAGIRPLLAPYLGLPQRGPEELSEGWPVKGV